MNGKKIKIVFMGTPGFAVGALKKLVDKGYNIAGVVTSPDKPAGRGRKIQEPEVKQFARQNNLFILQPENLKDPYFKNNIKQLKPDLFIVVAFRMLPKIVWEIPKFGTFNLHASLLPQYRGAAPINRVIINGETKTGVTTFFIDDKIDTGKLILQKEVDINENMTAGELHDVLMELGAELVLETVNSIASGSNPAIDQDVLANPAIELKKAPKIFKEDCKIDWSLDITDIYNFIRGLSPYPAAFTNLLHGRDEIQIKIFKAEKKIENHEFSIGEIITDEKYNLKIAVKEGYINILELQQAGKKRLHVIEFLKGFKKINECKIID